MMKVRVAFALCVIFLFSSCFTSCPFNSSLKPDSEIFGNFEPLHFEGTYSDDDYIIASALHPAQIQVWKRTNKNTAEESAELIRTYSFQKGEFNKEGDRNIWPMSVAMLHGNIWIYGEGVQKNFMRLNMATGELKFLELDCTPSSVFVVPKEEDDIGTLWIATRAAQGVGIAIRRLDDDGNIVGRYNVKHDDLRVVLQTMQYNSSNSSYVFVASSHNDFVVNSPDNDYFKLVNLKQDQDNNNCSIESIRHDKIYNESVKKDLGENFNNEFLGGLVLRERVNNSNSRFMVSSIVSEAPYISKIFTYKITSFSPFLEVESINLEDSSHRKYFIMDTTTTLIVLTDSIESKNGNESEFHVYNLESGKLTQKIPVLNIGEKVASYDNKTWFSKSVYVQNQTTREWIDTGKAIYRLDHDTGTVWKINENGTKEEMQAEVVP